MSKTILMLGAFDTKGPEHAFLREQIIGRGHRVIAVNVGVLGTTDLFPVDVEADQVADAGVSSLAALRAGNDRGRAMATMAAGAAAIVRQLYDQGRFEGIIGMGGGGGTSVITTAMQVLPVGVPKLCVSTMAAGNTADYVGQKDILLMPSIVDVAGVNRISRKIFTRAAGAICGMVEMPPQETNKDRPIIAASMFGNTTQCVDACRAMLEEAGYEVLVFHATGAGGRAMETLVDEGLIDAVCDITTTEWADEICGGVLNAGPDRLSAPGRRGVPHLIVPGCVDMCNFGAMESVPTKYKQGRLLYQWNPSVTLMRTTVDENRRLGEIFAAKANAARGPVALLLPLRGVSILDGDGELFCDRAADQALFDALKAHLRSDIPVVEIDANINDPAFAKRAVALMLELIAHTRQKKVEEL